MCSLFVEGKALRGSEEKEAKIQKLGLEGLKQSGSLE